jgi:hypothetical protein
MAVGSTESSYFYLMVDSAMEFQLSLIVPTSKVAGAIHPCTLRRCRVKLNEISAC